ncbi:hypothetical protein ACQP2F_11445 [Actinoplanes sp. CA-030573]|uniref:hypothetical protein n=1 Tax=Actinoplanes sp. CA-030573 TaxID=3239898 RepID=UPI003D8BF89B
MSDIDPENYAEFVTEDGPGSRDTGVPGSRDTDRPGSRDTGEEASAHERQRHPEQEAHGGSMAPGLVDDVGRRIGDVPPDGSGR